MVMKEHITRILLAEDDSDDHAFFKHALFVVNPYVELITVREGTQLLSSIQSGTHADMVFLDIGLPRKNGFECLLDIRTLLRLDLPIIVYSTSDEQHNIQNAYRLGANFYLTKPTTLKRLEEAIKYLLSPATPLHQHDMESFVVGGGVRMA